jgi:hypothetical protein
LAAVAKPPADKGWIWIDRERLLSPASRARSLDCIRFLTYLEAEHLEKGGALNGDLMAPYTQLVAFGIQRRAIRAAIDEAQKLGFIEVRAGQRGHSGEEAASRYRVTYLAARSASIDGSIYYTAPTHEWRAVTATIAAEIREEVDKQKRKARSPRGNSPSTHLGNSPGTHSGNSLADASAESRHKDRVPNAGTTSKNLSLGIEDGRSAEPSIRAARSPSALSDESANPASATMPDTSVQVRGDGPKETDSQHLNNFGAPQSSITHDGEEPPETFAVTVASLRAQRGMSTDDLARVTGFRRRDIEAIEAGLHHPLARDRLRIRGALAVPR